MKTLFNLTNYPDPFTPGTHDIWLDSDRKQLVLETHFNDDIPGGSKDTEFINKSVNFISKLASENGIKRILDLACGPGRYSNKLASLKFNVTGIDYNSEALDLARKKAKNSNNIPDYYCYDLKSFSAPYDYDLCLLIYQVYGSFPSTDRKKIVNNIYNHLKPGGLLLLDVLSENSYSNYEPNFTWFASKNDMFSKSEYISLVSNLKYPNLVTVDRNIILFKDGSVVNYNYWNQYFKLEDIRNEFESFGFKIVRKYGDVDGSPYNSNNKQFALLLEKV